MELRRNLDLGLCACQGWLPEAVGSMEAECSLQAQYNSETARRLRRAVLDGSFSCCNEDACPHLRMRTLPRRAEVLTRKRLLWQGTNVAAPEYRDILKNRIEVAGPPRFYQLCYDESCNLSCPSCRTGRIHFSAGDLFLRKRAVQEKFCREILASPPEQWTILNLSGTGDPFASELYRQLLESLDGSRLPRLKISLQTNGLLFTPAMWQRLGGIHGNVHDVLVSGDAATAETYRLVRRGGDWESLQRNLRFISGLRQRRAISGIFRLDFVVQQRNFREMREFVKMAKGLGVDRVQFHGLQSYLENSEMTPERGYEGHAVWRPEHPEFGEFVGRLADSVFDDPIVELGVLAPLRPRRSAGLWQALRETAGRWSRRW